MASSTATQIPQLTPRDARLAPWRAFVTAQAHVSRRLDEDLRAEHGLSLQEYVALLILVESPERRLRIGYPRAARLVEALEERGVVGPADGAKSREVLLREESPPEERGPDEPIDSIAVSRL